MHLDRAIAQAEQLFTEHKLPLREELIAELTVWRAHAQDGQVGGANAAPSVALILPTC